MVYIMFKAIYMIFQHIFLPFQLLLDCHRHTYLPKHYQEHLYMATCLIKMYFRVFKSRWSTTVNFLWCPQEGFQWILYGKPVRYLGCQIGINLAPEDHIAPLLLTIRKKLLYWNTAKLSLAGRVVVANQVLLASMWYILLAWLCLRSALSQVQRLIRNFL